MSELVHEVSSRVESLAGLLWDVYKEAHGFRPRHLYEGWLKSSPEELLAELKVLEAEAEESAELWAEEEAYWAAKEAEEEAALEEKAESEAEFSFEWLVPSSRSFSPFWAY